MAKTPRDPEERFWEKVHKTKTCWNWVASKQIGGYGVFFDGDKLTRAHQFSFRILKGKIPPGSTIDHLCRNRACVNPQHLEAVSIQTNLRRGNGWSGRNARKTHCPKGHPLIEGNLCREAYGRKCLTCRRLYDRKRYQVRRANPKYVKHQRKIGLAYYYKNFERDKYIRRERTRLWKLRKKFQTT